jgi:ATP-dependent DNA ligase
MYKPMLAVNFKPPTYPIYVQPKLDGVRCIAYKQKDKIILQTRTGMIITSLLHIEHELADITDVLDGELYNPSIPFNELAGIVRRKEMTEESLNVQYHVYDIINRDPFDKRLERLNALNYKHTVETRLVHNFYPVFKEYIEKGYEGIMLRTIKGLYKAGRSKDLMKYKEFMEDEFEIIGYEEGKGKDKGTVIWICPGFKVRPQGTLEERRELFKNAEKYIGKKLTVIYQELSEYGIPRFPVGKAVRENY